MFSLMPKCPLNFFVKTADASRAHCWRVPQTDKCNCKQFELSSSSSSSSLASDNFPVKLQSYPVHKIQQKAKPKAKYLQVNHEQYYSCNSEDSESEEDILLHRRSPKNKNKAFYKLLQKVEHLLNSPVASFSVADKSLNLGRAECGAKGKKLHNKSTSITLLTPLVYSHHPYCSCRCTCGMADIRLPPYSIPGLQLYNLGVATTDARQIPASFVCKETDVIRECSDANQNTITGNKTPAKSSGKTPIGSYFYPAKSQSNELDLSTRAEQSACLPHHSDRGDNKARSDLFEMGEEYVDEELHPHYVDKILTDPFVLHGPTADSLMEYDDEEPVMLEHIEYMSEEIRPFLAQVHEVDPSEIYESHRNSFTLQDAEEQIYSLLPPICSKAELEENKILEKLQVEIEKVAEVSSEIINETEEVSYFPYVMRNSTTAGKEQIPLLPPKATHIKSKELSKAELEENKIFEKLQVEVEKVAEVSSEILNEAQEESCFSYLMRTSTTTGRHIYNFLPEIDKSRQLITCNEPEEEQGYGDYCIDNELGKEKISESRKRKAHKMLDQTPFKNTSVATLQQVRDEASAEEMKFFIDSLIMDLEAMDYARRKSRFEKNICKTKIGLCNRSSFPVTITEVTDLGASSLYVKWKIHDCYGIEGYEIYTDGYLTNRYYNSLHDSAVITQVDITLPHKIALVAQACSKDDSIESICATTRTKNKQKSSACKAVVAKGIVSHTALWTPSIFLYDPITCRPSAQVPPINHEP